ncbi:MAG: aldo/keto reductase [Lachnospiraceae bacterium]|nr:aldo/keto reductase [Lachnospiraceae bacterium]
MRLPLTNPEDKTSIDYEELNKMVDLFMQAGFCYFDTAYLYHNECSEGALKKALVERYDRDSYILADKMPTVIVKSADEYPVYFERQLERTGVEYFDYYLMHNMGKDRYKKTKELDGFTFAMKKKEEGKIRNFGFSFHDDAETLDGILTAHPEVDFVQLQINYLDWENEIIQSRKCYETAAAHKKPVIVMEPVKGGTLAALPEAAQALLEQHGPGVSAASYALRFAAGLDNVMMVLSGMSSAAQVAENIRTMDDPQPLDGKERELLAEIVELINQRTSIPCTSCGYCMEVCPKNIAIPGLFGLYNNYKINGNFSKMYHERITFGKGRASDCIACGKCVKNCPQHLQVPGYLRDIAALEG